MWKRVSSGKGGARKGARKYNNQDKKQKQRLKKLQKISTTRKRRVGVGHKKKTEKTICAADGRSYARATSTAKNRVETMKAIGRRMAKEVLRSSMQIAMEEAIRSVNMAQTP
jgi:hypothetical protein